MKRFKLIGSFILFVYVLGLLLLNSGLFAQSENEAFDRFSISDGPYIIEQYGSGYVAFYICDGFFESLNFGFEDTLKFNGFCHDSGQQYIVTTNKYATEPNIIENVSKIVSISDIHGRYDLMTDILNKSKVIDENQNWIFGDGSLVVNGDIFDRGEYVTECLWLIYRLEQEAEKFGGAVHFILGNHELMVLQADNRYINEKYLGGIVEASAISHEDLYGRNSILGKWLRSKNTIVKLNNILFVHGGLAPSILDKNLSIGDINKEVRKNIEYSKRSSKGSELSKYLFGSEGPFWYRGYFYDMEDKYVQATENEIDKILDYYESKNIIVGHSGIDKISGFYNNKVINIHKTLDSANTEALLWENNKFLRVTSNGELQKIN